MAFRFKGGIHPAYNKEKTAAKSIEELPAPAIAVIPLLQHIGATCTPLVSVGDTVNMGQMIGNSLSPLSSPIHSSVSGKVIAIEPHWHPSGVKVKSIVIENDRQDRLDPSCVPFKGEITDLTSEEIIEYAKRAGVVGMGGAAFPLHVKLKNAIENNIETLIINGAECEPYLTADHRGMLEYPRAITGGIQLIMHCLNKNTAILAIESNKSDAIATMEATCEGTGITVEILPTKYPQGGERQIIKAVTGREIPPGKLPLDIGCAVFNIDTCASLFRAVYKGLPLIRRVVTVSGPSVITPKNLLTRVGTPYSEVFDFCGGFRDNPYKIINGGPMMGSAQHTLDCPVTKSTTALLAFSGTDDESFSPDPVCIRCGRCINVCPMNLMPSMIYKHAMAGEFSDCKKLNVTDCIECGCCSYACLGKLYLVQAMRMAKANIPAEQ